MLKDARDYFFVIHHWNSLTLSWPTS